MKPTSRPVTEGWRAKHSVGTTGLERRGSLQGKKVTCVIQEEIANPGNSADCGFEF